MPGPGRMGGGPRGGGFGGPRGGFGGPGGFRPAPPMFRRGPRRGGCFGPGCFGCCVYVLGAAALLIGTVAAVLAIVL